MNRFENLRNKKAKIDSEIEQRLAHVTSDVKRVSHIAHNSAHYLDEIEQSFEQKTSLTKKDISILFLAVALQVVRQQIFSNDKFRLTDKENEKFIKGTLENKIPKSWHDILLGSVPYDMVKRTDDFKALGDVSNIGISGATHRFRTLGHDPIMGWVVGPINIISDSLTKYNFNTYKIINNHITGLYDNNFLGAVSDSVEAIQADIKLLIAAIVKQAIHFGTDYFTKQGLPLPFICTVDNDLAMKMIRDYKIDLYSVTRGAVLSNVINLLIEIIHHLFYNPKTDGDRTLYKLRTKKIVTYSNVIASTSNILEVGLRAYVGDATALRKLDVGGILVTLYRMITDYRTTQQIKQEFLRDQFELLIMGE